MAFKRLVVHRSPLLVWFGVLAAIFWFAWMRAESIKTFDRLLAGMARGDVFMWIVGLAYVVFAYCVFRGLYGSWWRELKVDTEARKLRTCLGEVIDFDNVGAVSIDNNGFALVAAGAKTPLFRGGRDEVRERHEALAQLLGTRGRIYLHQLRRLTFHRSWALFVFTLIGFAMLTGAGFEYIVYGGSDEIEYKLMIFGGYAVCIMWFRRALFGSYARDQLYVDPVAGVLRLDNGEIKRLDELGALSIVIRRAPYDIRRRHQSVDHDLRAANVERTLYSNVYESTVKKRLAALETVVLQHQLRRALEAPIVEGDAAFRSSGLDPKAEVARIAGDSPFKRAALEALTHDPDPTVRERARQLL